LIFCDIPRCYCMLQSLRASFPISEFQFLAQKDSQSPLFCGGKCILAISLGYHIEMYPRSVPDWLCEFEKPQVSQDREHEGKRQVFLNHSVDFV
jgi:hypothetical protein